MVWKPKVPTGDYSVLLCLNTILLDSMSGSVDSREVFLCVVTSNMPVMFLLLKAILRSLVGLTFSSWEEDVHLQHATNK